MCPIVFVCITVGLDVQEVFTPRYTGAPPMKREVHTLCMYVQCPQLWHALAVASLISPYNVAKIE